MNPAVTQRDTSNKNWKNSDKIQWVPLLPTTIMPTTRIPLPPFLSFSLASCFFFSSLITSPSVAAGQWPQWSWEIPAPLPWHWRQCRRWADVQHGRSALSDPHDWEGPRPRPGASRPGPWREKEGLSGALVQNELNYLVPSPNWYIFLWPVGSR